MNSALPWQQYEEEVFKHFRDQYADAQVTKNVRVPGRYSKVDRQVDVLVDGAIAGFQFRVAVDAKHRSRPIDVTDVEAFVGFCADVGAHKGVLIALKGFTPAAVARVHNDPSDVELDVLNFADLKDFQALFALTYSGDHGVALSAPFGWIIDGTRRQGAVATLYQRGRELDVAGRAKEWMYINFWAKTNEVPSLEALLTLQEEYLHGGYPNGTIEYCTGLFHQDRQSKIRIFRDASYPTPEVTGFVDFSDFIFFCVMFSPEELLSRNMRKLKHVIRTIRTFGVTHTSKA